MFSSASYECQYTCESPAQTCDPADTNTAVCTGSVIGAGSPSDQAFFVARQVYDGSADVETTVTAVLTGGTGSFAGITGSFTVTADDDDPAATTCAGGSGGQVPVSIAGTIKW